MTKRPERTSPLPRRLGSLLSRGKPPGGQQPDGEALQTQVLRIDAVERRLDNVEGNLGQQDRRTHAAELRLDELARWRDEANRHVEQLGAWIAGVQGNQAPFFARIQTGLGGTEKDLIAIRHRLASLEAAHPVDHAPIEALQAALNSCLARLEIAERRLASVDPPPSQSGLELHAGPHGRFLIRRDDLIGGRVAAGEIWEPHVRDAITRHADAARTAVDAGAYIGLHSVHMARHFRDVVAVEPQSAIFHTLCGNLALNGCRNVRAVNAPLYDHRRRLRVAAEIPGNDAATAYEPAETTDSAMAITIDSLALHEVGFLKVDAQGADLRVLEGAAFTIQRFRPVITFEWEADLAPRHGTTLDDLTGFVRSLGYGVEILHVTTPERQIDFIAMPA